MARAPPAQHRHQGGEHEAPSDTLYALERAEALGADVLEMDLHMTSDGHVVVMHDETVDRTTDGTGSVEDMTDRPTTLERMLRDDATARSATAPATPEGPSPR